MMENDIIDEIYLARDKYYELYPESHPEEIHIHRDRIQELIDKLNLHEVAGFPKVTEKNIHTMKIMGMKVVKSFKIKTKAYSWYTGQKMIL